MKSHADASKSGSKKSVGRSSGRGTQWNRQSPFKVRWKGESSGRLSMAASAVANGVNEARGGSRFSAKTAGSSQ